MIMPSFPPGRSASDIMKNDRGFSLIESLLVVVMVGLIVYLLANLPNAINLINKSKHTSLAREIASKALEDKRAISYINLVNDNSPVSDSRISLLPGGGGTVVVEDCDSAICTNLENVKLVTVTINWKDIAKQQTLQFTTFIGEGGLNQ